MTDGFEDTDLMLKQSLSSFAFYWLVFYDLDGHLLVGEFVDSHIHFTEAALTDLVRPVEQVMLNFLYHIIQGFLLCGSGFLLLIHLDEL